MLYSVRMERLEPKNYFICNNYFNNDCFYIFTFNTVTSCLDTVRNIMHHFVMAEWGTKSFQPPYRTA